MKRISALILCITLCFAMLSGYAYSTESIVIVDGDTSELSVVNGMNIIEAMAKFAELYSKFNASTSRAEKKSIFEEAKALNDAFFKDDNITFNGYTEMLFEIKRLEAEECTLKFLTGRLRAYERPSSIAVGLVVNGVEQIEKPVPFTEEECRDIIDIFEKALAPGCIEGATKLEKEIFRSSMDRVRWRSGPSELVEKIEVLYNEIVNHPYLKTDDEFIEESDIIFSDVNESDWFYKYVMVMASRGYLKGKTTPVDGVGEFYPGDNVTRGEFIAIVIRILFPDSSYNGRSGEAWWQESYDVARINGFIHKDDVNVSGDEFISREEMAHIAYKALRTKLTAPGHDKYDISEVLDFDEVDERYKDSVFGAFSHILVNGNDLHLFNPKDNLTRAEAATVLYNLLSRIEDGSYPIP